MTEPLKILMVLHMPWQRTLGAARVQLELAEEFCQLGHQVEKFDTYDAFTQPATSLWGYLRQPSFAHCARAFVRAQGARFDIIDAHQSTLPYPKEQLNFQGLLVTRSVGLHAMYEDFARTPAARVPPWKLRARLTSAVIRWRDRRDYPHYRRSLETCDLINLPNQDEWTYVRDHFHLGHKCAVFPFGLTPARRAAFQAAAHPSAERLAHPELVFIGTWSGRKGAHDWPPLLRELKQQRPDLRCRFLGTGLSIPTVLGDLQQRASDWLEIVPHYDSEELPQHLSTGTVGAFPSYVEGFGFAVLEKLAAGIPTVAYDAPGPREMLKFLPEELRVPVGDWRAMRERLLWLLSLEPAAYGQLAAECQAVAARFCWRQIAQETLTVYRQALARCLAGPQGP